MCPRTFVRERHRYATALDPISSRLIRWRLAVNDEDAIAKSRGNPIPRVSTRFSLSVENDRVGAGRDSRTRRLARPHSQTRTGTGKHIVPCSTDHEQDWQTYPADTLLNVLPYIPTVQGEFSVETLNISWEHYIDFQMFEIKLHMVFKRVPPQCYVASDQQYSTMHNT